MIHLHFADVLINPIIIFMAGLTVGIAGGVFGNAANFVVVPILNILGLPLTISAGSGSGLHFGRASLSIFKRDSGKLAFKRAGIFAGIVGLPGVYIGFKLHVLFTATTYGTTFILFCYAIILFALAASVFKQWLYFNRNDYYDSDPLPLLGLRWRFPLSIPGGSGLDHITLPRVAAVGICLGITAGFLGLGPGMLGVPLYMYILGLPRENALATDAVTMTLIGSGTLLCYALAGRMEFLIVILLITAVSIGFHFGSILPGELNHSHARLAFSITLTVVALALLLSIFSPITAEIIISAASISLCAFLTVYSMISDKALLTEKDSLSRRKTL
jgi:uncharacterized membrane protein YfcA